MRSRRRRAAQISSFTPCDCWPRPPASSRAASGAGCGPRKPRSLLCGISRSGQLKTLCACVSVRGGLRGFSKCWNRHRHHPASSSISSRKRVAWTTSRRCARGIGNTGLRSGTRWNDWRREVRLRFGVRRRPLGSHRIADCISPLPGPDPSGSVRRSRNRLQFEFLPPLRCR